MKQKKITLTNGWTLTPKGKPYRVEQVENSTAHSPGEFLSETEVNGLCHNSNWRVVIKAKAA